MRFRDYLEILGAICSIFILTLGFMYLLSIMPLGDAKPYKSFTAECTQSTIQTQYVEQGGKRAMVVQCERAK